jgi:hypothetical protein
MRRGLAGVLAGAVLLAGLDDAPRGWPLSGASPDKAVEVPRLGYRAVTEGTRSYRPVAPLPWADVNHRVAPTPKEPPRHEH